jgi:glycosyltransferase involved in cell wall biosynthesis
VRILFVHEVNYLTKPIYEMHEFPEHLAAKGHEVAFWHFPEGYSKRQISNLGFKTTIQGRVVDSARITLFTPQIGGSFLGRLITAIRAGGLAKAVISSFKPDLIVSFSVPTQGWQLISPARRDKVPVMFRALDVSHKIRTGIFSKLIYLAEKSVYRRANWLSANNPAMLQYCVSMGANSKRASVEWPPLDLHRFETAVAIPGSKELLGIAEDSKVILYMGSFFYFSGLPEVVRTFAQSEGREHLVLIGGGEQDAELRELVLRLGIESRVTFTGFVSFDQLPSYLRLADVAINPMHRSLVANAAIPNKVIQYLAAGLPVVSTRLEGLEKTFGSSPRLKLVNTAEDVIKSAILWCRSSEGFEVSADLDLERFTLSRSIEALEQRCREVTENA